MTIFIIILVFSALVSFTALNLLMMIRPLSGGILRGFVGSSSGGLTATIAENYIPTFSFIEACLEGSVGWVGYFYVGSLAFLFAVWGWNLTKSRSTLVK